MPRATATRDPAVQELQDATNGRSGVNLAQGWRSLLGAGLLLQEWKGREWRTRAIVSAGGPTRPVSGDRGDTSRTLTVGTDEPVQRWATALTANRTVTLSTTGAANGDAFRVVRTGLGAFTLDVGGLKTIPAGTAAFVDVAYNGSTWVVTGYGVL